MLRINDGRGLLLHRFDDSGMAVARRGDTNACRAGRGGREGEGREEGEWGWEWWSALQD